LNEQRRRFEADVIMRAIGDANGDRRLAAQRLQISLSSLYGKLSEPETVAAPAAGGGVHPGHGRAVRP